MSATAFYARGESKTRQHMYCWSSACSALYIGLLVWRRRRRRSIDRHTGPLLGCRLLAPRVLIREKVHSQAVNRTNRSRNLAQRVTARNTSFDPIMDMVSVTFKTWNFGLTPTRVNNECVAALVARSVPFHMIADYITRPRKVFWMLWDWSEREDSVYSSLLGR